MVATSFACVLRAWEANQREIKAYLTHQVRDASQAEDLLQDVFIKAMQYGDAFCRLDNERAWLFQVARHVLIDYGRLKKETLPVPDDLAQELPEIAPVEELAECIVRVLSELAADDRDIIQRCDFNGMKLQAFADANGLTLSAVKSRIQRARQRLREHLTSACQVRFDEQGKVCCNVPRNKK